jgi:peptidoglycan/xylan/chitin deacetylase (PgdA/CDA1 family)
MIVINYHGITELGGGNANLHCLPIALFREQMHHLKQPAYSVTPWEAMLANSPTNSNSILVGITFDDGRKSDVESARFLRSLGYSAIFFIATKDLGKPGYIDRDDVIELQQLGMGIGSHSHEHVQLKPFNDARVRDELAASKQILEGILGTPVEQCAFPGGSYDARILDIARQLGYRNFFTSDWGVNRARHFSAGLLRRTSIPNNMDMGKFDALLQSRNYFRQQIGFYGKELLKQYLGEDRYYRLRQCLLKVAR